MTFEEIYQAAMRAIGDAQYSRIEEVKAVCNQIYLTELLQCDELRPLFWLLECDDAKKAKPPATITGITAATPPVVTAANHGFATGDVITIYDVLGMTELDNRTFHITRQSANSFSLQDLSKESIGGSLFSPYTSSGKAVHRGTVIASCARVYLANWHGYNKGMDFIGPEQLESEATWMDKSASRPVKAMHRQLYTDNGDQYDYLLWFQGADSSYNLRLWTERQAIALEDEDETPLLPAQFHPAIIAGAVARLGVNAVQVEAGVVWPGLYQNHIAAIRSFNRKWWESQRPFERSSLYLA